MGHDALIDFDGLMAGLGPFEPNPHLAVAVSGGPDSVALMHLAADWVAARSGRLVVLTVDHGLRPGSADEARQVGHWAASLGLDHHILPWMGAKPASGVMQAARQARYGLLDDWCRQHGVMHLLCAHHQDDQTETIAMRQARGSGLVGLAGMGAVRDLGFARLLRPLLSVSKDRLRHYLLARGQDWIADPSNGDLRFERARLRTQAIALIRPDPYGHAAALRSAATLILAHGARLHPAGFAILRGGVRPDDAAWLLALSRLMMAVGGQIYPPRRLALARLFQSPAGMRTLHGCRLRFTPDEILITRELGRCPPTLPLMPGQSGVFDNRFAFRLSADAPLGLVLSYLGAKAAGRAARFAVPAPVRAALPVIRREESIFGAAKLGYKFDQEAMDYLDHWVWIGPQSLS